MNNIPARVSRARLAGVGCISAAVLLVELGITRLFSVITWSHFAFLAVSLALFGASALAGAAAACFASTRGRRAIAAAAAIGAIAVLAINVREHILDLRFTKAGERPWVFTKWNSHSRVAVYPERHLDWGLSPKYTGTHPFSYFMDIDASASTEILVAQQPEDVTYLRDEVTAFAYRLMPPGGRAAFSRSRGGRGKGCASSRSRARPPIAWDGR